ncbi:Clr5 domain protein [Aspergillus parasiticus SU-1]|uniref:Clr5 domain protein n=1 Tax=Aspergillus parasiticus (strain ATCC 56775 / NRRL 5862 / SRRC 143 / SU-1) TaxID=1403190 RepID=A0A0F0ICU8_ASPPU|nr:Clr5 domain protein [Aspergillus parasiticus SU-1]
MKHTISFRMWEMKRGLIIKLYQEEEWPLKQVLKRIRSDTFNPSETQLRSRLKKWGVTKLSRRRSQNKFIMSHCEDLSSESCLKSPVYSGDEMAHSASTSHSTTKDDFHTPERGDTMHEMQTASGIIPHDSFHSSASAMSAITPSWEYHDVSPGYHSRFIHPALNYYNPAMDRPKAELTSSQWPMTMSYGMLPEDVNNDSAARFYTTAPSGMFMHQPAQFTPFPPQSDWFHAPDCQLVYQPS